MSVKWYPVINYENCIECGGCVEMCPNAVYEKGTNKPKVIYPEGCGEGCHGCQSKCPASAIEYAGDNGTVPGCECGCSCSEH